MGTLITQTQADIVEQVIVKGDLSKLTPAERVSYYRAVCESIGLNPLTKPFEYIDLDGKLTLYARRDATDQLRKIHNISVTIVGREKIEDVYIVTAKAMMHDGRSDESTGVVSITKEDGEWKTTQSGKRYFVGNGTFRPLRGDALANALMKAETKSKRRVTLSLCGLGWLDETEIETISDAKPVTVLENGDLGVKRPTDTQGDQSPAQLEPPAPESKPEPQNGGKIKSAVLRYLPFKDWCNEWVKDARAAQYADEKTGTANMHHVLNRVGMLGFAEVTAENFEAVKDKLQKHVEQEGK